MPRLMQISPTDPQELQWEVNDSSPKPITIPILDNTKAVFNEDIEVELNNPRDTGGALLALGQVNKATVTILYDKQPAGAVDRNWNPECLTIPIRRILNYPGTDGGVSDGANGNGGTVNAVAEQPDGKVIVAGAFISFDSNPYKRIVRLLNNGYQDPAFLAWPNSGADDTINAVVLQPDKKLLSAATSHPSTPSTATALPGLTRTVLWTAPSIRTGNQWRGAGNGVAGQPPGRHRRQLHVGQRNQHGECRAAECGRLAGHRVQSWFLPYGVVYALAVDSTNRVYIGGGFDKGGRPDQRRRGAVERRRFVGHRF